MRFTFIKDMIELMILTILTPYISESVYYGTGYRYLRILIELPLIVV